MSDLSVTAANVRRVDGDVLQGPLGGSGVAYTAGMVVYYDPTTSSWLKAQADGTAAEAGSSNRGFLLAGGSSGQTVPIQINGNYNPGGTLTVAGVYIISATAGSICPTADVTTTNYFRQVMGVASSASNLIMFPQVAPVALP